MTTGEDEDQVSGLPKRCVERSPKGAGKVFVGRGPEAVLLW